MPIFFADDSNLFVNGTDVKVMESQFNDDLCSVSTCLKVNNKLSLTKDKTQIMISSRKKYKNCNVDSKIEAQSIDKVHHTNYLGIIINDNLNWKNHVNYISNKIAKGIGILIKARHYLDNDTLCHYTIHLYTRI